MQHIEDDPTIYTLGKTL